MTDPLSIDVPGIATVAALLTAPHTPSACYVMAHGAGAGMTHPFMGAVASGLGARGIATLRYQFPYTQSGARRPDRPPVAHATVRAAIATAARLMPGVPLIAGGKSFGARMTSQTQAASPLPGVAGLVAFGFPLHPAAKPSDERASHLSGIRVPMLFVQGDRDALAETRLLTSVMQRLNAQATLHLLPGADHAFHVPARSGRTDDQVLAEALDYVAEWLRVVLGGAPKAARHI